MVENQQSPLIDPSKVTSIATPVAIPTPVAPGENDQTPRRLRQPTADKLKEKECCWGTGRRKASVARVRLRPGSGKVLINKKKDLEAYFANIRDRADVLAPLAVTENTSKYDLFINVNGGGTTGQAGACLLGVARALAAADPDTFDALRQAGFLTRDSREVERKKYGLKKARKSFQFSKR